MGEQQQLHVGSVTTEGVVADRTVWVVAADMMEGGHPQVLAVYDNEDAAREHEQAIRDNHGCTVLNDGRYSHQIASFWTYEQPVRSEFPGAE